MKAQGQGLLSHSQHGSWRFAALTSAFTPFLSLCTGISFPRTRVWHRPPLQPFAAVTSRMLTWRNAGMANCSLWLGKKKEEEKERKGHFPVNFPWRSKLRDVPWWRHWQHQTTLHHSEGRQQLNDLH